MHEGERISAPRYHLVDSDIFTRGGYRNGPDGHHPRGIARKTKGKGGGGGREGRVRKIVTAKDFEFSPRKESAAETEPSFSPTCACIMHAQAALREKCLGSRKARPE